MSYLWKTAISILSTAIRGAPCKLSVRKRQRCSALHHMLGLPLDARNCTASIKDGEGEGHLFYCIYISSSALMHH